MTRNHFHSYFDVVDGSRLNEIGNRLVQAELAYTTIIDGGRSCNLYFLCEIDEEIRVHVALNEREDSFALEKDDDDFQQG